MKKNKNPDKSIVSNQNKTEKITRKEALIKTGKYAAFTAVTMLTVLSPKESQAQSPLPKSPGW